MPKNTIIITFFVGLLVGAAVLYGVGHYYAKRLAAPYGNMDDEYKEMFIVAQLDTILREIEMFNLLHSRYPSKLDELRSELLSGSMYIDPASRGSDCGYEFFYFLDNQINRYHLMSVGVDRILFSEDDILPSLANQGFSRLGITTEQRKEIEYPEIECYEWDR